jgi:hypothetical protein
MSGCELAAMLAAENIFGERFCRMCQSSTGIADPR